MDKDNIVVVEPNNTFDFSAISLAHPTGIQGGAYFTKILNQGKPLYIQTPKSLTKQSFVKNGKKVYCDLMFDNNDATFIHWLENLETKCQDLIFDKGSTWFENKLEKDDIETAFTSPMKVYKSGKYYLVRVNVKVNTTTMQPNVKIYNEHSDSEDSSYSSSRTIDDIVPETKIISIVEVQGIKFTSRNFQIELELKQIMILNPDVLFENCLIKSTSRKPEINVQKEEPVVKEKPVVKEEPVQKEKPLQPEVVVEPVLLQPEVVSKAKEEPNTTTVPGKKTIQFGSEIKTTLNVKTATSTATATGEDLEEVNMSLCFLEPEQVPEKQDEYALTEISLTDNLDSLESMTLKKPNQVYYEIYKEARKRAKKAKKEAVLAFLEAKNIKKTYMLDDLDESDQDSDSDSDDLEYLTEEY